MPRCSSSREPEAEVILNRLRDFSALGQLETPAPPSEIRIRVVDGIRSSRARASKSATTLVAHGFVATGPVEDDQVIGRTEIRFGDESADAALTAIFTLGTTNAIRVQPPDLEDRDVVVRIGERLG